MTAATGQSGAAPLGAGKLIRFSAVAFPMAAAAMPLGVYLPAIYARDYALSLTTIGAIFLAGRLWDAITDPLIGALSDRTRSRFGRRKPWILAGGAVFTLAVALLFFPVAAVTPVYLAATLFLFYAAWTAIQIPFLAWSGEVSGRYHERTRVATFQTVVASVGLLTMLVLPTLADQLRPGDGQLQLTRMGSLLLAATIPAVLISLTALPEPPAPLVQERFSLRESLRAVFGNPLLLRVLASDFAVTFGQATRSVLIV